MSSKKIVLSADETTATVTTADLGDIFTTMFSANSAVTGFYKYAQLGVAGAIGGAVQKKVDTGSFGIPFVKN